MDSLARYVATACISGTVAILSRYLEPRIKIVFWQQHDFLYKIPMNLLQGAGQPPLPVSGGSPAATAAAPAPALFFMRTQAVNIQNLGRKPAEWVEVVHAKRPDFFQLYPALNYTEDTTPNGEHVIRVSSLGPKEYFSIQFLSYMNPPQLLYIRSAAGQGQAIPVMPVRQYPRWANEIMRACMAIGVAFTAYWVIRACEFLLKAMGVL
jgi:hypothetical protein